VLVRFRVVRVCIFHVSWRTLVVLMVDGKCSEAADRRWCTNDKKKLLVHKAKKVLKMMHKLLLVHKTRTNLHTHTL